MESELLVMNWNEKNCNEAMRQSAIDLLNGNYKNDDYLVSLIEKVHNYEISNELKKAIPYRQILINTLYFKVYNSDFMNCEELFNALSVDTLPLISTSLIFALEEVSFQIQHKNSVEEKDELYCKIKRLFEICIKAIRRYSKDVKFINICSKLFSYSNEINNNNIKYEIANYRINLMFAYKIISDIEADYISVLSTGNTWQELENFFNEINS